jgi:hypothetical protein
MRRPRLRARLRPSDRLPLACEQLETRTPVSDAVGPVLAVSALAATAELVQTARILPPPLLCPA